MEEDFNYILSLIHKAKSSAYKQLNNQLNSLYYSVGKYVSEKVSNALWGKSVVDDLSHFIKESNPTIKGFSSRNIWRMKQFYETYSNNTKLSTLSAELTWSHNTRIMTLKTEEERAFYLTVCSKQNYSVRELNRLIDSSTFERTMLADNKVSDVIKNLPQNTDGIFKDSYVLEFLDLPIPYKEKDLSAALISSLKDFILELGSGFSFIGQEYKVQVGTDDFFIDLLFFHRHLKCLVAFELKTTKFKPADLGQLEFYLEALDRDVKRNDENPSIGILLCREKNDEVVKYALSRSMSPAVIAEYETKLIPKRVLQKKLNEFYKLLEDNNSR
ncbi:DUF1016 domain-containing protein (plasmid) [Thiospirochaeta perfilievii]|uniref:DUF1016 domain-containing protein n=1 Tax=Thiospirochaeta perfilievii TaxID=252967 RepID=A0A5C1QG94_9SPIO|nr:DUF1016 domain-containing protein [Thiospirochaeta perfilievii]